MQIITHHRGTYTAYAACRARLWTLHDTFDPDYQLQGLMDVLAFLVARCRPGDVKLTRTYIDAESACVATARAEDAAWQAVANFVPTTPAAVREWVAYVLEHSAKEDEVVTLRRALEHVAGMLVDLLVEAA